eukprot:g3342.t1
MGISTIGMPSASSALDYCLTGHRGPLCAVCDEGYSRWSSRMVCSKCPENMGPSIGAAIGAALGLGVLLFLCLYFNRRAPNGMLRPLINAAQNLVVIMMFSVDWPESVKVFQKILSGINFDFVQIASPSCLGIPVNFYGRFASTVLLSAAVIGGPWLASCLRYRRKNPTKWAGAIKGRLRDTFLLVVLLHPSVSGQSFYHFRCRSVNNTWYLMADMSLECYDTMWFGMLAPVVLTILGFAIGMPVLFARLLWARRTQLQNPDTKKLLGVLYMSYKPDLYWFESVTMLFKLSLWATLVYFEHGSQFQLATSVIVCCIQLAFHARLEPFNDRFKNAVQYVSLILVAFTSFSGLILNYLVVSAENARLAVKEAEGRRVAYQQATFKTITAVIIWAGAVLIILQVVYYAIRFTRKHGAAIQRITRHAASATVQILRRRLTVDGTGAAAAAEAVEEEKQAADGSEVQAVAGVNAGGRGRDGKGNASVEMSDSIRRLASVDLAVEETVGGGGGVVEEEAGSSTRSRPWKFSNKT